MARQKPAKSALRKLLDKKMDYTEQLTGKPFEVKMKSLGGTILYFKPVGSVVKDLYLPEIADNKMSGFVKCLFYRAMDKDGRRIYNGGMDDLQELLDDPNLDHFIEFARAVTDREGMQLGVTDAELDSARKNSESTQS